MILPDPLFVSDAHDLEWHPSDREVQWIKDQGVDPQEIYRYEIYLLETMCARIYQYVSNDQGVRMFDEIKDTPIHTEYMIPISSYPPGMKV